MSPRLTNQSMAESQVDQSEHDRADKTLSDGYQGCGDTAVSLCVLHLCLLKVVTAYTDGNPTQNTSITDRHNDVFMLTCWKWKYRGRFQVAWVQCVLGLASTLLSIYLMHKK